MAYTLENLDRVGVWYLDGPGHFAQYNFVGEVISPPPRPHPSSVVTGCKIFLQPSSIVTPLRQDHPCVRLMREIVPGGLFEPQGAPIATVPTDRAVAADGLRWLKVSKTTFNTALISVQSVGTELRTHAQGATA